MDFITVEGVLALVQIILIDILLAGDNAIVIGMAAKNLQPNHQKQAIFWGTFGAIALRLVMAFLFIEALNTIPALHLVGGILLLWIGHKLLVKSDDSHSIKAQNNLLGAIATIIIADGIMGIDNVLGVVGAANGNMTLVTIGMLITVPIIIWGSTLFVKVVDKYPIILYIGGAILAWVGAGMILDDALVHDILAPIHYLFAVLCVIVTVGSAVVRNYLTKDK